MRGRLRHWISYSVFLLYLVISSISFAGVDFAMIYGGGDTYENYTIPLFASKENAEKWAHKIKWVEPIRRKLRDKREEWRVKASRVDLTTPAGANRAGQLMQQWEYCDVAYKIMMEYKKNGVGSFIMASSIPVKVTK